MAEVTRRRIGRPTRGFEVVQLNVRVHPKIKQAAKEAAAERGLKEAQYLAALIARDTRDEDLKDFADLLDQEVFPFSA